MVKLTGQTSPCTTSAGDHPAQLGYLPSLFLPSEKKKRKGGKGEEGEGEEEEGPLFFLP